MSPHITPAGEFFNQRPVSSQPFLELITKHHIRPRCGDLVINVKPVAQKLFPVIGPALLHNEINRIVTSPFVQDRLFIQEKINRWFADRSLFVGVLINEKELPVEIKNETAAVVERPLKNRVAAGVEMRI